MPLTRPIACEPVPERNVVRLAFPDGTVSEQHLRGGIAWPVRVGEGDQARVVGHVVLVGVDVSSDTATVWEHAPIDLVHVTIRKGKLIGRPLAPFVLQAWTRYHALRYYWHGDRATALQYTRQVADSEAIIPRPTFGYVHWDADEAAEQVLWRSAQEQRLRIERDLMDEIQSGERNPEGANPAKDALVAALVGLTKWPWYEPEQP